MSEIIKIIEGIDRLIYFLDEKNWHKLRPDYAVNSTEINEKNDRARRKWLHSSATLALFHANRLKTALDILNGI